MEVETSQGVLAVEGGSIRLGARVIAPEYVAVQRSRSRRQRARSWLQRALGRAPEIDEVVHVELRLPTRRLRLEAEAPVGVSLKGSPWLEQEGCEPVSWSALTSLLEALAEVGARELWVNPAQVDDEGAGASELAARPVGAARWPEGFRAALERLDDPGPAPRRSAAALRGINEAIFRERSMTFVGIGLSVVLLLVDHVAFKLVGAALLLYALLWLARDVRRSWGREALLREGEVVIGEVVWSPMDRRMMASKPRLSAEAKAASQVYLGYRFRHPRGEVLRGSLRLQYSSREAPQVARPPRHAPVYVIVDPENTARHLPWYDAPGWRALGRGELTFEPLTESQL